MSSGSPDGRNRHRAAGVIVRVLVLAAVLSLFASSATGASHSSRQAAFRHDLMTYLVRMQQVASALEATPQGRAGFKAAGYDPASGLARAQVAARRLTPAQLALLEGAFAAYPAWRTLPAKLTALAEHLRSGPRRSLQITPDDCATARAAGYTQTDVEAAADASLAAEVILEAVPQDTLAEAVRIIAVAAWAVPQGVQRGFEHLFDIASACDDNDFQSLVSGNLDAKVSTRATQSSLDTLTTKFNGLNTLVNNRLDVAVSTRATQTSLNTFRDEFTANATAVNTKLDNLTIKVSDQGALNLRLHIEAALSQAANPIALFEIPASGGGYLDLTRSIVADTIAKMQTAGQSIGNAQTFLAAGDAAASAHQYKTAYSNYGKAYRAAAG